MARFELDDLEIPEHLEPEVEVSRWFSLLVALGVIGVVVVLVAGARLELLARFTGEPEKLAWDGPEYFAPPNPHPVRVGEFNGWEHCDLQSIRFLHVPTRVIPGVEPSQYEQLFVRASSQRLLPAAGDFDQDAELPADAQATEYTDGDRQLWFAPSEAGQYAYIVDGNNVERWPRFDGGCD